LKETSKSNESAKSIEELADEIAEFQETFRKLLAEAGVGIVGYEDVVTDILVAIFSNGHVLLEGVPGLGKTYMVRVLSRMLDLSFGRVQCTPDLMPADILGTHIVDEDAKGRSMFRFQKGPIFAHMILVDEVNRATPKTQSALLEAMQEHRVTAGDDRFELPEPFFVLATQNPLEMEGTYPLPEAQLDRFFFKLQVPFPDADALVDISKRTTGFREPDIKTVVAGADIVRMQELLTHVGIADPLTRYAANIVLATHPDKEAATNEIRRYVSYGASPRGLQALVRGARAHCLLANRTAVSIEDIRRASLPALRHRVILNFEGEAESVDVDALIKDVVARALALEVEAA